MSDNFDEVLFPVNLSVGAAGGPEYRTQVVRAADGREVRTALDAVPLRRYQAAAAIRSLDDTITLLTFFQARCGRLRGFRWRDPLDYAAIGSVIGMGDGVKTQFQLSKTYVSGATTTVRIITKPDASTLRLTLNGAPTSAYVLNASTGMLTMTSPPAAGVVVAADFEFHVPVRFDVDHLAIGVPGVSAAELPKITVVEVQP